ncbi:flagellar protein FlaG [Anaerovibrio lipolyticus DSM 3074]|uniref:Flagellar protein FlaG n=1 Tax=Anaerovibrio lipolyticus DSM 3074 TaxID=1120997 RepID=A0A1M6EED4_9FIRM|nr:flagellar protein FlaG [Anaerovibrio lipolyticus]SHI83852.1 flagellar protein FlaG [Anaerovibrio lipolyticus DSM 3074]
MVGSISDMTAAAVVVSAMDNGASQKRTAEPVENKVAPVDIKVDEAGTIDRIAASQDAGQADNEEKEQDPKQQALDNINEEFVSEMTKELNELMSKLNCDLEFQYHKEVNVMSVKMIDKKTNEVIKEYPPEEMVEGMIKAQEWLGAFLDRNA